MEGSREVETLQDSLETLATPFETERMDSSAYVSPNEAMQKRTSPASVARGSTS